MEFGNGFFCGGEDNNNTSKTVNFQAAVNGSPGTLSQCPLCHSEPRMPRVLNCLHSFCEGCLVPLLTPIGVEVLPDVTASTITCPTCSQVTYVSGHEFGGVQLLLPDFVTINSQDFAMLEATLSSGNAQVECNSCKSQDSAMARCFDCLKFLCARCEAAHRSMTHFDEHQVLTFAEMQNQNGKVKRIHRPVNCPIHPAELLKYFCKSCQASICDECQYFAHKVSEHEVVKIDPVLQMNVSTEIQNLVSKGLEIVENSAKDTDLVAEQQRQLQSMSEFTKQKVVVAFDEYKRMLEKRQAEICEEIDSVLANYEDKIVNAERNARHTTSRINDGCKFAEKLLGAGNPAEILSSRKAIVDQLQNLLTRFSGVPHMDFTMEFLSDMTKFAQLMRVGCGQLKSDCRVQSPAPDLSDSMFGIDRLMKSISAGTTFDESFSNNGVTTDDFVVCGASGGGNSLASAIAAAQFPPVDIQRPPPPLPPISAVSSFYPNGNHSFGMIPDAKSDLSIATAAFGQASDLGQGVSPVSGPLSTMSNCSWYNNGFSNAQTESACAGGLEFVAPQPLYNSSLGNFMTSPSPKNIMSAWPPANFRPPGARQHNHSSMSSGSFSEPSLADPSRRGKMLPMQIRCKFGCLGPLQAQFNSPHGFCMGEEENVVVADTNNHRIQIFDKLGNFKYQFGIAGKEDGQLWYPRKVAVITGTGKFVICDRGSERSRMQLFGRNGYFLKKIAVRFIDIVAALVITKDGLIVAVDSVSPTVFVINENGDLIKWFDCSSYMSEPSDIAIHNNEFYVCDFKGHCVAVFTEEGKFIRRIGCKDVTPYPNGIDVSDAGDVLVGNSHGNTFKIAVFNREGGLTTEFECSHVKVSRCCGLKITSEGFIVTLAKNNHHVLVLNTLYLS